MTEKLNSWIYTQIIKTRYLNKTCTGMFTAVLFTIDNRQQLPKCLSKTVLIKEICYIVRKKTHVKWSVNQP